MKKIEVEEYFIGNDGDLAIGTGRAQAFDFGGLAEMARWIIRMHDYNSAGARCNGLVYSVHVDLPAVIVEEGIARERDILDVREEIEERIAGLGNEYFVSGIAQCAKDEGVGFTGAGG